MNEVTWALEESMFKFDIEWRLPDDRAGGRNNAMWYTNKIDPELVCTVKIKDKSLPIYRVGEMLIKIRNEELFWTDTIRFTDDLYNFDFIDDYDLLKLLEFFDTEGEKAMFEVDALPAFYVGKIEHDIKLEEDCHFDFLSEAILCACRDLTLYSA